jgi:hypothetical protein
LAVIAIVGPTQIASFVHKSVVDGGTDSAVATDDIAPVAAKVAALSPASKVVWADMFHACATSLRADSAAEPAVLRTLESMRRFHVAVGRFAWKAVGGNASDPELAAALEKLFSARFGDADRFLTADDREQLAATYDSLAALAK